MFLSSTFEINEVDAEVFVPVVGHTEYEVSNHGRVRSLKGQQPTLLTNTLSTSGYLQVTLRQPGRKYTRYVHKLVMEAFAGRCPAGQEVCHEDGDRLNARLDNVRYDTPVGNAADKVRHGTNVKRPMLTEDQVRDILLTAAAGETIRSQAKRLNVLNGTVADVRSGKSFWYYAPELPRGFRKVKK